MNTNRNDKKLQQTATPGGLHFDRPVSEDAAAMLAFADGLMGALSASDIEQLLDLEARGRWTVGNNAIGTADPFELRAAFILMLTALVDQPKAVAKALDRFRDKLEDTRIQPPSERYLGR